MNLVARKILKDEAVDEVYVGLVVEEPITEEAGELAEKQIEGIKGQTTGL